jgi:DeoR/GlpR family transcriptional regulator of sugar metabolism
LKRLNRLAAIMDLLEEMGNASTVFLANNFQVSESSIRRDIDYMVTLERYKDVKRVHGGVVLDRNIAGLEYMFELKLERNRGLKLAVAREARKFINDGDTIIIDSGTTCLYLAQYLYDTKRLHIVTTDIKIAEELGRHGNIESNIIGGTVRAGYYTVGGSIAIDDLKRYAVNTVFMSVDAVDIEYGITNSSAFEVGVKQYLIQSGKHVYVMADSSKLNTHTLYKVADITAVHTVITNKDCDPNLMNSLRERGIEVILA